MNRFRPGLLILLAVALLVSVLLCGCSGSSDVTEPNGTPSATAPVDTPTPAEPDKYIAVFHTSFGDITLELFRDKVPVTVDNFVRLVRDGFYDDMLFYRVSDDFMIQAGLFTSDWSQKFSPYGPIDLEINPEVTHVDGAISMARTNDPDSATAQFFICDGPQHFLDNSYAAFGVVIDGIEVVREIAAQPHDNSNPAGGGVPLIPIVITSAEIQGDR